MSYTFPKGYLSPSQVTLWQTCGKCYELQYVEQRPTALGINLPLGGAVHKGVEHMRRVVLGGEIPDYEDVVETAVEYFEDDVQKAEEIDLGKLGSVGEAKDQVVATLRYLAPRLMRLDEQRGLVRTELDLDEFESPFPFPMKGRVDALYGPNPGECNAGADLKTAARADFPGESISLQIGIYREFIPVVWMVDQVTKARKPTLTTYELGDDGRDYVFDTVIDVADHISRGDFPARPSWMCRYSHGSPSFSVTTASYAEAS